MPQKTPSYNPTKRERATNSTSAGGGARRRERRRPARRMQRTSNKYGLALVACDVEHGHRPDEFLPHPPGGGHAPQTPATCQQQRRGRGPTRTCPSSEPSSAANRTHDEPGQGASQKRGTHGRTDDHRNVIRKSSRTLPSEARIKGYVRRWDESAPPPGKVKAWDAGADSAHVTCGNGARDTFPAAQKVNSVKEREGGFDTDQYSFPPDPTRGTQGTVGSPHGTREPAGSYRRGGKCTAKPGLLRRMARPGTTARAEPAQLPNTALRHQHASHITRETRHDTAQDRQADPNTSTASPSRSSTLELSWGARQSTKGGRRGLPTDGSVHMNSTGKAERAAKGRCEIPDDGLCV